MEHLRVVIEGIEAHGLQLKIPKCSFGQRSVQLLGHVVDKNGLHVGSDKSDAIKSFQRPRSATELRVFLGISGYYWRFIKGFPNICRAPRLHISQEPAVRLDRGA